MATELRVSLGCTLSLLTQVQTTLFRCLPSDGPDEKTVIDDLIRLLDGPEQRAIMDTARKALQAM